MRLAFTFCLALDAVDLVTLDTLKSTISCRPTTTMSGGWLAHKTVGVKKKMHRFNQNVLTRTIANRPVSFAGAHWRSTSQSTPAATAGFRCLMFGYWRQSTWMWMQTTAETTVAHKQRPTSALLKRECHTSTIRCKYLQRPLPTRVGRRARRFVAAQHDFPCVHCPAGTGRWSQTRRRDSAWPTSACGPVPTGCCWWRWWCWRRTRRAVVVVGDAWERRNRWQRQQHQRSSHQQRMRLST